MPRASLSFWAFLLLMQPAYAQPRPSIVDPVDETDLVRLAGNTRPEVTRATDLGPADDSLRLDMYLQLKRSPAQETAAGAFVESLTDKSSPNFHKWVGAAEFGRRFGVEPRDIEAVSGWLKSHGFTINNVPSHRMLIDFSGTAGQVRSTFHTEIHNLDISGKRRFANMSDPSIPRALSPAVAGVVSMSNIQPEPMLVPKAQYTISSSTSAVVPGDLAAIYNLNQVFAGGYTGKGQTVVVVEDTDVYTGTGDWNTFRQTFGLAQYASGSLTQVHPGSSKGSACIDPGVNGDDVEAALDVEWASAAAPDAAIVMASCGDTTNFGGFIALQNMLTNGGPVPGIVSISYGSPETAQGAAENSFINTLYQTAAAAGVSIFVSSGDSAAAGADRGATAAVLGVTVSGFASTPYNVAVGGTDFGDYAAGSTSAFWSPLNSSYYNSARSYVPEIPWNDSCAGAVANGYFGLTAGYGGSSLCNTRQYLANTTGGSGGPSGCATGAPSVVYAVSGTCAGYAKPSWQSVFGNPGDGVRDIPDVSLFASNGFWGRYYVICISGGGCSGAPSNWFGVGGTSASSPIMAGIQALINQALGAAGVGNPNPIYYEIARSEYNGASTSGCDSSAGPAAACAFNDITQGDIVVPCAGVIDCFTPAFGLGVLSTSTSSFQPAYAAAPGWDFATGLGSVNAMNLLNSFVASLTPVSAPKAPALVSPADAATGVAPSATLSWNVSAGATSYDVYFGTASTPPKVGNTSDIVYSPGGLNASTTYYWAVGARNSVGTNVSAARSFTTGCVPVLNPSSATISAAGGTASIPVTAAAGCAWTAVGNSPWIAISSGATGSGNGTVAYTVSPDAGAQRSGTISIAGQTFTVTQGGIYPLISTIGGGGMAATTALGTSLAIPVTYGLASDSAGNVYFSSSNLNAVFRATSGGQVTRIAGTGIAGFMGDGGPALGARLNNPNGVAVDSAGNVYFADTNNYRIRRIDTSGNISTVAGNGRCCTASGDGGSATGAVIGLAYAMVADSSGNLYFSDIDGEVVRKVSASGLISTAAGNGSYGFSGDGGPATSAKLYGPYGLAVDGSGNLYIADSYNGRIRKVSNGNISTVAGTGGFGVLGDGGPAINAYLELPFGVAVDGSGNFYIADEGASRVRKVNSNGTISTVAGTGSAGFSGDGGGAAAATLAYPYGIAVDPNGNVYVADSNNERIRQITAAGMIGTFVGGAVNDGGQAVFGLMNHPVGVARDNSGNTYVADTNNNRVRMISAAGIVTTVAGTGIGGYSGDAGPASAAQLNSPQSVAADGAGNVYIADTGNYRVRKVDSSGNIATVAGTGSCCSSTGDGGAAVSARLVPYGLALDSSGDLFISDVSNNVVRKVVPGGTISTVAGNGTYGFSGDGGAAAAAELREPYSIAVDGSGNLYIADTFNGRVREVTDDGKIATIAGNAICCALADGGQATSAYLGTPYGVAVDGAGNVFIADGSYGLIREVNTMGVIATVAGSNYGYVGDGNIATAAALREPRGLAADSAGNIVVADEYNNAVRVLTPALTLPVLSVQSSHSGSFAPGQNGAAYAITVSNGAGAGAVSGAVTVADILPAALSLSAIAGQGWTCSAQNVTCTRSDSLAGGASYPPIVATVNVASAAPSQVTNLVSVTPAAGPPAGSADLTVISAAGAGSGPSVSTGGVVPVYTSSTTIQPGEWASIYGSNLAGTVAVWNGDFPTSLAGTSVTIGGLPAYLSLVSPGQINFQVPTGIPSGNVPAVITTQAGTAGAVVNVASYAPSFFLLDAHHVAGIILRPDGSGAYANGTYDIIGPGGLSLGFATVAAQAGDSVVLFGTGFGPTNPSVAAGQAFAGAAPLTGPVTLSIGGTPVATPFAGISGAGTYQFNLTIPPGLGAGDVTLQAAIAGSKTPTGVVISLR